MRYENAAIPGRAGLELTVHPMPGLARAEVSSLDLAADAHRAPLGHRI